MTVYHLSTRVNSNDSADSILYNLCVYRIDSERNKHVIVDVKLQPIQADYQTLQHATSDIREPLSTIYIMEVMLYHKTMLHTAPVLSTPFTHMYTLEEFSTGKAWSPVKRENPCYFITTGTTKRASEGGAVKTVKISRPVRPFIAKEYPIGDPADPFEIGKVGRNVNERFNQVNFPYQGGASACGPAALFYCLQRDRPDVYMQAARELWQYGKTKIGELEIRPGEGCRHPSGSFYRENGSPLISGLDWITLVGLRDSENDVLSFDSLDSPLAGVTLWTTLSEWFNKVGYELVFSNVGITQAGIKGVNELNEFVFKGYRVVTLINDGLLDDSDSTLTVPTHWIVWEGPVTEDSLEHVHLELFSWGSVKDQIKEVKKMPYFISRFFGGMVFKPLS